MLENIRLVRMKYTYMRCVKDRDLESNVVPLKLVKIERSFGCIFKG